MREEKTLQVPEFPGSRNRDLGKVFKIREWPATRAERWGLEAMFAMNKGAEPLPPSLAGIGMEGIAIIGINNFLRGSADSVAMIGLWAQLLECVAGIVRDPVNHPNVFTDINADLDIQEIATLLWLRSEVLSLHLNFSVGGAFQALYSSINTAMDRLEGSSPA